jgi:hypothetical protein
VKGALVVKRKLLPAIVAVVVIVVGGGWIAWDQSHIAGVRNGQAFGSDGSRMTLTMTTVRKGDDVYYMAPSATNFSDAVLTFETVTPAATSPGLDYVEARIYKRDDFVAGIPLSWGTSDGSALDPGKTPSRPVRGYQLKPGQDMNDDIMFLHFRVTTGKRPLETSGVAIEYSQKRRTFEQVLPAILRLANPS